MDMNNLPQLKPAVSSSKAEKPAKSKDAKKAIKTEKKIAKKAVKAVKKEEKKTKKVAKAAAGLVAAIVTSAKAVKPELTNPVEVRAYVIAKAAVAFNKAYSIKTVKKMIVDGASDIKNAVATVISDEVVGNVRVNLASKVASKVEAIASKAEKAASSTKKPLDKATLEEFAANAEAIVNPSFSKATKSTDTKSSKPAKEGKAKKAEKVSAASKPAKIKKSAPKKKLKK